VKLFVIGRRSRSGAAAPICSRAAVPALEAHSAAERVCAFARTGPSGPCVTLVPRLLAARGVADPVGPDYWE
jgi:hypothetical protein